MVPLWRLGGAEKEQVTWHASGKSVKTHHVREIFPRAWFWRFGRISERCHGYDADSGGDAQRRFYGLFVEVTEPAGAEAEFVRFQDHVGGRDRTIDCVALLPAEHDTVRIGAAADQNDWSSANEWLSHAGVGQFSPDSRISDGDEFPGLLIGCRRGQTTRLQHTLELIVLHRFTAEFPNASPGLYSSHDVHMIGSRSFAEYLAPIRHQNRLIILIQSFQTCCAEIVPGSESER